MKKLDFKIPFNGYSDLHFLTAFAAVSLYIDGVTESDDYVCARKETGKCNNCRLCRTHRIGAAQESRYMLFETLCGISGMMQTPEEIK